MSGIDLEIATKSDRDTALEKAFYNGVTSIRASTNVQTKYTNVFHDRFWIADEERGLFIGTSLNGIGHRYAVSD
jgi:hypothetical protein